MLIFSFFIEILYVIANAVINTVRFLFAKVKEAASKIPDSVLDEVARALLPNILDYFASDRGKKEFAEWKKKKSGSTDKKQADAYKKEQTSEEMCSPDNVRSV